MTAIPVSPFGAQAAHHLLNIGAVHLRPEQPFTLTSGRLSPVYVDCRKIISFPIAREALMDMAIQCLDRAIGLDKIDVFAGGETAGIPFAAFLATRTGKPMVYVRKRPKGFGRGAQIEGELPAGARTVLIEDFGNRRWLQNAIREGIARRWGGLQPQFCGVLLRHYCRCLRNASS